MPLPWPESVEGMRWRRTLRRRDRRAARTALDAYGPDAAGEQGKITRAYIEQQITATEAARRILAEKARKQAQRKEKVQS